MTVTKIATHALTAFCAICPAPETVTAFLHCLGLRLDFHLEAVHYAAYEHLPDLPAQYHYYSRGIEVIYLEGPDTPLDGERFPRHASRFWAYAGSDGAAFRGVVRALSARWLLTWQRLDHDASGMNARKPSCALERKAVPA